MIIKEKCLEPYFINATTDVFILVKEGIGESASNKGQKTEVNVGYFSTL